MISLPYVGAGGEGILYHIVLISKTAVGAPRLIMTPDSGASRNDGLGRRNDGWDAGMTVVGAPRLIMTLDSGLRRNDGLGRRNDGLGRRNDGWDAGMTVGMPV